MGYLAYKNAGGLLEVACQLVKIGPAKFYAASSEEDQEFTRIAMLLRDLYGEQYQSRGKTDLVMKDTDVANFLQACAHLLLNYEPLFTADEGDPSKVTDFSGLVAGR